MARSLQELQKQYHSSSKPGGMGGPGGPRGGGPRGGRGPGGMGGKPKDAKKTIGRLLKYVGKYKALLFVVLFFMMLNTVFSLIGGYMTRPIINRLSEYMASKGKSYDNRAATIRRWAVSDTEKAAVQGVSTLTCKEGTSL